MCLFFIYVSLFEICYPESLTVEVSCTERTKIQCFQSINVSSVILLQGSDTTSLIILIVNMETDVSVVRMPLSVNLIFVMRETRNSLEMLEEGSD